MFKNIELSEINKKNVMASRKMLFLLSGLFSLIIIVLAVGMREIGFLQVQLFSVVVKLIFCVWPILGVLIFIYFIIEQLTLSKRSNTRTVIALLLVEMVVPIAVIIAALIDRGLNFTPISFSIGIIVAQWIRWHYLKHKNRMYNYSSKKYSYEN